LSLALIGCLERPVPLPAVADVEETTGTDAVAPPTDAPVVDGQCAVPEPAKCGALPADVQITALHIAEMTGDDCDDVLLADTKNKAIHVMVGDTGRDLACVVTTSEGFLAYALHAVDMSGDGVRDLVMLANGTDNERFLAALQGTGGGDFTQTYGLSVDGMLPFIDATAPFFIESGYTDDDTVPDLVFGGGSAGVHFRGVWGDDFQKPSNAKPLNGPDNGEFQNLIAGFVVGDAPGSGHAVMLTDDAAYLFAETDGFDGRTEAFVGAINGFYAARAPVTGASSLELMVGVPSAEPYYIPLEIDGTTISGEAKLARATGDVPQVGPQLVAMVAGDLNSGAGPDVVLVEADGVDSPSAWLFRDALDDAGTVSFPKPATKLTLSAPYPRYAAVGDVDGDGRHEVWVVSKSGALSALPITY